MLAGGGIERDYEIEGKKTKLDVIELDLDRLDILILLIPFITFNIVLCLSLGCFHILYRYEIECSLFRTYVD